MGLTLHTFQDYKHYIILKFHINNFILQKYFVFKSASNISVTIKMIINLKDIFL